MVNHLKIIEAGVREKGNPSFLSTKEIECPRCGRMEYANGEQGQIVMCSLCLQRLCLAEEIESGSAIKPTEESTLPAIED